MNFTALLLLAAPLISLDGGTFVMGRELTLHDDEKPAHQVTLAPFQLQATLVTNADFREFVTATHYRTSAEELGYGLVAVEGMREWEWAPTKGATWRLPFGPERAKVLPIADDWPVTMVSWVDADAYCRWSGLRLPSEAEWEFAMRAGATTRFPWGDSPERADGGVGLNYWQGLHTKNEKKDPHLYLSAVRAFEPNAWGFFDPVGNVWQLTHDWYAADAYAHHERANPHGPDAGVDRVSRGGSWWCSPKACTAYGLFARGKAKPTAPFNNVGFRCAR